MASRMPHHARTLPKRQRGAVIVLIVIAMLSMLLMAALALDGSHMLVNKTRLQNAVDAAALSGAKTLLQVGAFVAFMLVIGRKIFPWFLWRVAKTGSRELFTLAVMYGCRRWLARLRPQRPSRWAGVRRTFSAGTTRPSTSATICFLACPSTAQPSSSKKTPPPSLSPT